jgi:parallel beta-helix repeat protein
LPIDCLTGIQIMTNSNNMTCYDSQIHQSTIFTSLSLRTGLAALLVVASGTTLLSTAVNASSAQPSQAIAQTVTPQAPAPAAPTSAKVIYVNPETGSDTTGNGVSATTPYKTITKALEQAEPGTVIQLAPGSYTSEIGEVFPLSLKQGVTLRGDESTKGENILISGGGRYISPTFARQDVAVRAEKDTTISGVTITNPNTRGTGLWIESTSPTVTNNTFANSDRDGIFMTGTAAPKIEANVFTKNSGNGISVARSAQGEIRNNVFQETGFGLAIGGTSAPLVTDNQINQSKDGIYISESARPILRNNVIENNERDGVVATINAQPDLGTAESTGKNIIRDNKRYDVYNATRSNTLLAVGNDINPKRISGKVNFVAAQFAFRDIKGLWAQPYIEALAAQNIIAGFPDGTFKPNEPVTRAQFAAIVSKAFSPKPQREAVNFGDVSRSFWGYQAIQTAYRGGFVAGYPGGLFQPKQEIPRVQALVSLANGLNLSVENPNAISIYSDAGQIPNYAAGPVAAATQRKLVVNYPTPNQLNPNREATRAEIAAFVYQALVNSGRVKPISSPYLVSVP